MSCCFTYYLTAFHWSGRASRQLCQMNQFQHTAMIQQHQASRYFPHLPNDDSLDHLFGFFGNVRKIYKKSKSYSLWQAFKTWAKRRPQSGLCPCFSVFSVIPIFTPHTASAHDLIRQLPHLALHPDSRQQRKPKPNSIVIIVSQLTSFNVRHRHAYMAATCWFALRKHQMPATSDQILWAHMVIIQRSHLEAALQPIKQKQIACGSFRSLRGCICKFCCAVPWQIVGARASLMSFSHRTARIHRHRPDQTLLIATYIMQQ